MTYLQIRDLRVVYPNGRERLKSIHRQANAGEIVAIIGRIVAQVGVLLCALALCACVAPVAALPAAPVAAQASAAFPEINTPVNTDRSGWPSIFRVGLFGGDDVEKTLQDNYSFRLYLEAEIGVPVDLFIGTSYTAVVEAMRSERVDGILVGPFAYLLAVQEAQAEALAVTVGLAGDTHVYDPNVPTDDCSVIFTKKGSGINPDEEMQAVFADSHPTSVLAVWSGNAAAGVTDEDNLYTLANEGQVEFCGFEDGRIGVVRTPEEIKAVYDACPDGSLAIIAYTRPIADTLFAVRADLQDTFKDAVKEALLDVKNQPELIAESGQWYVDPSEELGLAHLDQLYDSLRDIARLLDLDLKELAN